MKANDHCMRGSVDICLRTAGPGDKTNWQSAINYIEQLERIIYDCLDQRDIMLANHSEDIYNRIVDKYDPTRDDRSEDES